MKTLIILLLIIFTPCILNAKSIPSYEINNTLKSKGHFIRFIGDKKYKLVNIETIRALIKKIMSKKWKYIDSELLDCDDLSLIIHAEVRKQRYENKDKLPIAFGEAVIKDIGENHALNFFITDDKNIYIFDPYTFRIYPVDKVKLLFIRM